MRSHQIIWSRMHFPARIEQASARAALIALAGVPGSPLVVFEVVGTGGRVAWRVGSTAEHQSRIRAALAAHLDGVWFDDDTVAPRPDHAAGLRAPGTRSWPLRDDATDTAIRGLLAVLASATANESVRVQLVLGVRRRPHSAEPVGRTTAPRPVAGKAAEQRFACDLRLSASSNRANRAHSLISRAAGALRALEAPHVGLRLVRVNPRTVQRASAPWIWHLTLSTSEAPAFTGWPIADADAPALPGVPSAHPRPLPPVASVPRAGRILGDAVVRRDRVVAQGRDDARRHTHVIGGTGTGKSTLLAQIALQDIEAGYGAVVVDPKADLIEDLLARIPASRQGDVVVLDPTDPAPIGLQPLGGTTSMEADLSAETVLGVFHSLYRDSWGPRTHDVLASALLTLARRGDASLVMVPLLLTNPGFRRSVVQKVAKADPLGLGSFWNWYEHLSDAERTQAIAPLMNKLRSVLLRPGLRAIFGQRQPKFSLQQVFTERKILLVALRKDAIGEEAAHLLGSIVVSLLWQTALRRTAVPEAARHPVSIVIDEFQDVLRLHGSIGDALAQARSLNVSFTLAHQYLGQLPKELRAGVFANARSRISFAVSDADAGTLAAGSSLLNSEDFRVLPRYHAYAQLLVDGSPTPPCLIDTRPLGAATSDPNELRAGSRARYGQPIGEVERDLLDLIAAPMPHGSAGAALGRKARRATSGDSDGSAS